MITKIAEQFPTKNYLTKRKVLIAPIGTLIALFVGGLGWRLGSWDLQNRIETEAARASSKATEVVASELAAAQEDKNLLKRDAAEWKHQFEEASTKLNGFVRLQQLFEGRSGNQIEDICVNMFQVTQAGAGLAHTCGEQKLIFLRGLPEDVTDSDQYQLKAFRRGAHQYISKENILKTVPQYVTWHPIR